MNKTIWLFLLGVLDFCICFAQHDIKYIDHAYFKALFSIRASGEFIDVNTGHAAPYIYDYNKDGVDDLLVGEFGKEYCPGLDTTQPHAYVQGRCRIYINHGSNQVPIYKDYQWLLANGKPAFVPVTCCISFVPRFVDLDGDGSDDVVSGSYPGEIYFFKGLGDNNFNSVKLLVDIQGDTLRPAHSTAVDPIDWDNDGDYDLLISTRSDGLYLVENVGNKTAYKFAKPTKVLIEKYQSKYDLLDDLRQHFPSYAAPLDWNGDGLFDLVCGAELGDLIFYPNIGKPEKPAFGKPVLLWDNKDREQEEGAIDELGGRVKIWVYDYDGDGKLDILAGDILHAKIKIKDLTPKEEMLKNTLSAEHNIISKQLYSGKRMFFLHKQGQLTPKEENEYRILMRKNEKLEKKLEKLENYKMDDGHGFVWVLLAK